MLANFVSTRAVTMIAISYRYASVRNTTSMSRVMSPTTSMLMSYDLMTIIVVMRSIMMTRNSNNMVIVPMERAKENLIAISSQ